jgi:hypothetical protein
MRNRLARIASGRALGRVAAGLALLIAVAVVVVLLVNSGSNSPGPGASNAAATSGAVSVQRRDLVETDTESGTLSYNAPQTVYDRLTGTVTWLPSIGDVVKPGGTLFKISGRPVVDMDGSTPAYRDLHSGISDGLDVLELNRNLVDLGFNPDGIVVDDVWQAATTAGVDQWQASLGETETGDIKLGQVVFLPGDQLIGTVDGTLGATGGSGTGGTGTTGASYDPLQPPKPDFVSDTLSTTSTPTTSTPTTTTSTTTTSSSTTTSPSPSPSSGHHHKPSQSLAALIALLRAEIAELRASHSSPSHGNGNSPSKGNSGHKPGSGKSHSNPSHSNPGSGSGGASGTAILQTSSTHLICTVDLSASSQSEAVVGGHVTVELPAGNSVGGTITAVSSVAQTSSNSGNGSGSGSGGGGGSGSGNSGGSSTIPVTIALHGHHLGAGLDQAAVSVNFSQARANNVLSVPVTALLAVGGGNYAVQEATAPHKLIPVTTGLFAAGYVQISGSGIYPGLQVTDSQG